MIATAERSVKELTDRERALIRGQQQGIQVAAVSRDRTRWVATSSKGDTYYHVWVDRDGRAFCDCPGAMKGFTCKHAVLVEAAWQADREAGQPRPTIRSLTDLFN